METISTGKAQNLFWLGRYVQRVYDVLRCLRQYRDLMIEDPTAYRIFCAKIGIDNIYASAEDFWRRYLFDGDNAVSLISALTYANHNAITLREEIKSETLAYVQLSIAHLETAERENRDINFLQLVTDNLLAFWGAVDELMPRRETRNMLKVGKYIETFDLHLRFDYPRDRLLYLFDRLERRAIYEKSMIDQPQFLRLKMDFANCDYDKKAILARLNNLLV